MFMAPDLARALIAAEKLAGALSAILKLHEAHHNDPLHAQARERLTAYRAIVEKSDD